MNEPTGKVVRLEAAQQAMRQAFLGWQCRIRQLAIRQQAGRPTAGMRPVLEVGGRSVGPITVLMIKDDGGAATAQFRHMVKRTHDPLERYEAAVQYLAAAYYHQPMSFTDRLTALFGPQSELPSQLNGRDDCRLRFAQFNQRYHLCCLAERLAPDSAAYQATYWHNALFNPDLPAGVQVVEFTPDWCRAEADPAPP